MPWPLAGDALLSMVCNWEAGANRASLRRTDPVRPSAERDGQLPSTPNESRTAMNDQGNVERSERQEQERTAKLSAARAQMAAARRQL